MAGIKGFPGFIGDLVQGSTRDFTITMQRSVDDVLSVIDITGAKFYVSFAYDTDKDTTPEFVVEIDPPTDPTNGITTGEISASDTIDLTPGTLYYSVRYISPTGKPLVIDMGKIKLYSAISGQVS